MHRIAPRSIRRARRANALLAAVLTLGACDLPRDSDGTLDRVRGATMRVGMVADTPWVTDSGGVAGGVEGALVAELARRLDARVEWIRRSESELLEALHTREVDLVIAGLGASTPWAASVGLTRPYYTDSIVVGVPVGEQPPAELTGLAVSVEPGDPVIATLRTRGAVPRPVRDLRGATGLVAAPIWRLHALGRVHGGIVLREEPRALAVIPGENAWLVEVEALLRARRSAIPARLRAAAR